jgi:hypothetical protein
MKYSKRAKTCWDLFFFVMGQVASTCECGNEPLGSIKWGGGFLA